MLRLVKDRKPCRRAPTYCGNLMRTPSMSFLHECTTRRATSSAIDQSNPDAGCCHPKALHVSATLSSSRDVPRKVTTCVTRLVSRREMSTVRVGVGTTTGSTSWCPSNHWSCWRRRAFSDLREWISDSSEMTLASFVESSTLDLEIVFGLLLFRSSAIGSVCEQDVFLAPSLLPTRLQTSFHSFQKKRSIRECAIFLGPRRSASTPRALRR